MNYALSSINKINNKMKKIFTFLALVFVLAGSSFAGDRLVLVERFTSSTCPPCASNNPIMDAFLNSQDPERIIGLSYHMDWPAPGNDPMHWHNVVDNTARRNFYSVNSIPQARMDGLINIQPSYNQTALLSYFQTRTGLLSPVTIVVTDAVVGDSIVVRARIYCEVMLANPMVVLQFVIMEKHITNISPPATNGETDFYDVMRKMPVSATGELIALYPGQTYIVERKYKMNPAWNPSEIRHFVFLQQGQEMMNVGQLTKNFTLIPNSSYKSVQQGQSQSATYQMQIPVTTAGYNSAVTLSAEVDPPTAGVTVSFPGGNTVSTFPANFDMNVSSTATVPAGAYRIIVTGTNTNNKTHKTSVSYLVGQNFISVNTNRTSPNLQFVVDNTVYSSAKLFTWNLNTQHTLAAVSPQTYASTRYVFNNWSNNGDSSQTITVGTAISNYTVFYRTQFKLITNFTPSNLPVTITSGNIFHDSAASVTMSPNPFQLTFNGKEYYFQRWNGTGNGSYSGTNPTVNLTMNNVILETAVYDTIPPIGIQNLNNGVPVSFSLHQNFPNPFNPVTKIKFDIPKMSSVNIKMYDVIGNEVGVIYSGELAPGYYEADFNASNYASGVYFYKIEAGEFTSVKRMVLVK
jgi:Secretion system C-terminal sorting domain